jgi:hypothetical protein
VQTDIFDIARVGAGSHKDVAEEGFENDGITERMCPWPARVARRYGMKRETFTLETLQYDMKGVN